MIEVTDTGGQAGLGYTFAGDRGSDLVAAATGLVANIVLDQSIGATVKLWNSLV